MEEIRLGMIGCGQISTRFFDQAARLEGVRFVATCATHEESARAAAAAHGCPRWYTDYEALLRDPEVDAVVVTTPHQWHARMGIAAAQADKHMLLEKPMATRWDEAVALARAVEASGVIAAALPFERYPNRLAALDLAREEIIGKITAIEADFNLPGPPRSNWYYSAEAGGGAMLDTMPYSLSEIACFLGPARQVSGMANTLLPRRLTGDGGRVDSQVDDNVVLVLEYATGQHAVARSCWAYSYFEHQLVVHGRHGAIFLGHGDTALVVKSDLGPVPGGEPVEYRGIANCYSVPLAPLSVEDDIMGHFIAAVRGGEQPTCSVPLGLHVIEQMMRGYESAATGTTLALETSFVPWQPLDPAIMRLDEDYV